MELGPGAPESWLTYIQYLAQTSGIDLAKPMVAAARRALPAERSPLTLAECSLMVGDLEQAETLIQSVLTEKPRDPTALRVAADVALAQNRIDKVNGYLNDLDRVTNAAPGDRAWVNRTRIRLILNAGRPADRDRAMQLVEENLRDHFNSVEDQILKAMILAQRPDRRADAITILARLTGANGLDTNGRFLLAQLYLDQHEDQKYRDVMLTLLDRKTKDPRHLAHFVNFWIGRNPPDQADRWLGELKRADPQGLSTLELEVKLLNYQDRRPEVLARLEAYSRQRPDQIGPVAELLSHYGFARQAEEAYRAFLARDPRQPERILALAGFLGGQDRVSEALEILEQAGATCHPDQIAATALALYDAPSADEAHQRQCEALVARAVGSHPEADLLAAKLGVIWVRQGRSHDAEELFRRILNSHPDSTDAMNGLAWLLALQEPSRTAEALRLIDRAIQLQGPDPSLLDTRAVVLIRSGQPGKAIQDLKDLEHRDPRNPISALHLAWAYQSLDQVDRAKEAFQKAVEFGWKAKKSDPLARAFMDKLARGLGVQGD